MIVMNILVLGGSYFLGYRFVKLSAAAGHKVTVFNRGTRPLNMEGVSEIRGDRTSFEDLSKITGCFEATVDFCAYERGISCVLMMHWVTGRADTYLSVPSMYMREGPGISSMKILLLRPGISEEKPAHIY